MLSNHVKLRELFAKFWEEREHKLAPPISLIPKEDPTTLFTGSGMQPLVPYLLGEPHPQGEKLYNIQPCFRAQDIEEVGDNRHTTFFEMMGNWSLGTYFKKEQISWFFEFLTKLLGLPKERLYVTVFEGTKALPKDKDSAEIWKKLGIPVERIFYYGVDKNWWSRAGAPEDMPPGEPGGPDSEVFYDFGEARKIHEKSQYKKQPCHPNCECGRFLEIGNSVFMQYQKQKDGSFKELPKKNVDFGGGLERTLAALHDSPDVFRTDLYDKIIQASEESSGKKYEDDADGKAIRIVADHLKAAVFLIKDGVRPSNKERGYILRRLLRRVAVKYRKLTEHLDFNGIPIIARSVLSTYDAIHFDAKNDEGLISIVINEEMDRFSKSLERGLKEIESITAIDGKKAFDLYQTYGFPLEITEEIFQEKGQKINHKEFQKEFGRHQELSRTAATGRFKGGLADESEQTIKYHTATHLLHQALFDVLGEVRQEGSNITQERLRFDFYSTKKPTEEEIKKVEKIANGKVNEALPVNFKIIPKEEAFQLGALAFFKEKYGDRVKIYYVGAKDDKIETAYSKEFCGGPHVKNTKDVGKISIYKFEKIGGNLYRLYAR
ncbi:alanine--tRNA ligase [Candidatus Roizmanbacteria bacterium]|nr:alanine--tRNA ligase [Candidatus Roizmanbacteria bacterium]